MTQEHENDDELARDVADKIWNTCMEFNIPRETIATACSGIVMCIAMQYEMDVADFEEKMLEIVMTYKKNVEMFKNEKENS